MSVNNEKLKVLVLGASGMLGNALIRTLTTDDRIDAIGSMRSVEHLQLFPKFVKANLLVRDELSDERALRDLIEEVRPDCIVNCVGVIKQQVHANNPVAVLPINSIFPHQLAEIGAGLGSRIIHISTDCVFSGKKGSYKENDFSDVNDLYGMSKFLGELKTYENALTLRTSIIGHELYSARSLVDWFLSQEGSVRGFDKAVFSGLPTTELAALIVRCILDFKDLKGLYHVATNPINKYELLCILKDVYEKDIDIVRDSNFVIDRSLDSSRFNKVAGYQIKEWPQLIVEMKRTYDRWVNESK